jgi:hypothetical protein
MNRFAISAFLFLVTTQAFAQAPAVRPAATVTAPPSGFTQAIVLWPNGAPGAQGTTERDIPKLFTYPATGVATFALEYRLSPAYMYPAPMQDASRAIRYVRSHAAELGVKSDAIGVWGFSAGGHLSAYMGTTHSAGDPSAKDPIDQMSDRPELSLAHDHSPGKSRVARVVPQGNLKIA